MTHYLQSVIYTILLLISSFYSTSYGQQLPSGPQVLTVFSDVDDTEQPYGLYLPKNYNTQVRYPLVIMLHGAGSNHRLALRRVFGKSNFTGESDLAASQYFPPWDDVPYIVVAPYARGTAGYQGVPEKDVYDVLDDVKRRFSVDEDRVYLTGLSMGGGGTLWLGLTRPDTWAAIAPVCPAPPQDMAQIAGNASNIPIHLFHGEADPVVPVAVSRDLVKNFESAGADVAYDEYPGVMHDSWVKAYEDGYIFEWFAPYKRNKFPNQVKFASRHYKYNRAYWVELDVLEAGQLATIVAQFTAQNQLEIKTEALNGFTLQLTGHPLLNLKDNLKLVIDGHKISIKNKATVHFVRVKGKWQTQNKRTETGKRTGLEGPVHDAFATRHVYIYGTLDNPSDVVLQERIKIANEAANWSVFRGNFMGRYMVFPRVLSDKEADIKALKDTNLILFGTKETNAIIAENSTRLPLHLSPPAANRGLLYVFPLDGNYVVVSSGLPWWNYRQPERFNFLPANLAILPGLKDYMLFEDDKLLMDGFFNENWQLTEEEKKKLASTNSVDAK